MKLEFPELDDGGGGMCAFCFSLRWKLARAPFRASSLVKSRLHLNIQIKGRPMKFYVYLKSNDYQRWDGQLLLSVFLEKWICLNVFFIINCHTNFNWICIDNKLEHDLVLFYSTLFCVQHGFWTLTINIY